VAANAKASKDQPDAGTQVTVEKEASPEGVKAVEKEVHGNADPQRCFPAQLQSNRRVRGGFLVAVRWVTPFSSQSSREQEGAVGEKGRAVLGRGFGWCTA